MKRLILIALIGFAVGAVIACSQGGVPVEIDRTAAQDVVDIVGTAISPTETPTRATPTPSPSGRGPDGFGPSIAKALLEREVRERCPDAASVLNLINRRGGSPVGVDGEYWEFRKPFDRFDTGESDVIKVFPGGIVEGLEC